MKKNVLFALFIAFALLTLAGATYVLTSHGQHNAGYAVAPMALMIAFRIAYDRA